MNVRPVPLTDEVKQGLAPSFETSAWTWCEVEKWIAAEVACAWQIGRTAWAITAANADNEIDIVVAGGSGANKAARPFILAMENLPEHAGWTLRLEGRRGWKRFCKNWQCEDIGGGNVVLTRNV